MKHENKDICSKCGGRCCKKSGCDYSTENFDKINAQELYKILEEGKISIVSLVRFEKNKEGKEYISPFLYLRARNKNRPVVDLISMKTTCSQLTETGCAYSFEERPKGGVNLIPSEKKCYPDKDPYSIVSGWEQYQNLLRKIVKRLTGKSVEAKIKEDIEELFYNVGMQNFEGVSEIEIADIIPFTRKLIPLYLEEASRAVKRVEDSKQMILKIK